MPAPVAAGTRIALRDRAGGHAELGAAQRPARAVGRRAWWSGRWASPPSSWSAAREHELARGDARQQRPLLLGAAELRDRQRAEQRGLEQRDRRRAASGFFEDQRELEEAEPAAAVRLGQRDAEQARLRELPPQLAVEARRAGALERALALVARALGEDLARELGDLLLIVAEGEIHGRAPRLV